MLALTALGMCAAVSIGLLVNLAEAFGWMKLVWYRQRAFAIVLVSIMLATGFADLGVNALLIGVALAQWTTYALTLIPFVRRGVLT